MQTFVVFFAVKMAIAPARLLYNGYCVQQDLYPNITLKATR